MNEIAEQIVEIRKCQDALRMLPPGVRENETDPLAGQLERLQRASPRRSAWPGMVLGKALSIAMLGGAEPGTAGDGTTPTPRSMSPRPGSTTAITSACRMAAPQRSLRTTTGTPKISPRA